MYNGRDRRRPEAKRLPPYESDVGPYHIVLAVLIHAYADTAFTLNKSTGDEIEELADLLDLQPGLKRMRSFLLSHVNDSARMTQLSLQNLLDRIQVELDEAWQEKCSESLRGFFEGLQSPNDLIEFEAKILRPAVLPVDINSESLGNIRPVDPQTDFGLFYRSISLFFKLLPFEAICTLYLDLRAYMEQEDGAQDSEGENKNLSGGQSRLERQACLEEFIETQVRALERKACSQEELKQLSELTEFLGKKSQLKQVHMLKHAIAMQYRDHEMAVQSLHSYFDCPGRWDDSGAKDASTHFQGALLNLGATHTSFGRSQDAMAALNECARVAQQVNDDVCLQQNLAELCRLQANIPVPKSEKRDSGGHDGLDDLNQLYKLLKRCHKRSRDLCLPHLEAYAISALAQFECKQKFKQKFEGEYDRTKLLTNATKELQNLYHTSRLSSSIPRAETCTNCLGETIPKINVSDLFAVQKSHFHPQTIGLEEKIADATQQMTGSSMLNLAAYYFQSGERCLGESHAKSFLTSLSGIASSEDKCLALALLVISCHARQGPDFALMFLEKLDCSIVGEHSIKLKATEFLIRHSKALNEGNISQAEEFAESLKSLAGPVKTLNIDIRIQADLCILETLLRVKEYDSAEVRARKLFLECKLHNLQGQATEVLLFLAKLHQACEAYSIAIKYACTAQEYAEALELYLLNAEAKLYMVLAENRLHTRSIDESLAEVLPFMPLINKGGSLKLQGLFHWTVVSLHLNTHKLEISQLQKQRISSHLEKATECYKKMNDWEMAANCCHAAALFHNFCQDFDARDFAAKNSLQLQNLLASN